MPGKGFAPSGRAQKKSRNQTRDTVKSDGKVGGYGLPTDVLGTDAEGNRIDWHPQTVRWWESWRASPQGTRMVTDVDWDFLLDTARMHHEFWTRGRWEVAAELRLRVANFGATPEDRARLRLEIEVPEPDSVGRAPLPTSTERANSRRDRLMSDTDSNVTPITPATPPF